MKRVDAEPLSEQRWAKVEKEVFAQLDAGRPVPLPESRSRRGVWARGLAVACAAAALVAFVATRDARPERPLHIATAGESQLVHLEEADLELAPHSAAVVGTEKSGALAVTLAHGAAELAVRPTAAHARLTVEAADARIDVLAARFRVVVLAAHAEIFVHGGELIVHGPRGSQTLGAGAVWTSAEPVIVEALERAVPAPSAEAPEVASAPHSSAPLHQPVRRRNHPHESGMRELYERAARIEGTHPDEASALYFELSQGRGTWAENALFALGRLELERGQRERGRSTLSHYLQLHPRGRNVEDARRLLAQPK
jgi:ferric-dicitrate binding protein FerR (iron transport regulator)